MRRILSGVGRVGQTAIVVAVVLAVGFCGSPLLAADGVVFSFGLGATGLGVDRDTTLIATPIDTTYLAAESVAQVAAGYYTSFVMTEDGTAYSFGSDDYGKAGLGDTSGVLYVATPVDTTNLAGKKIIQAGTGYDHSVLLADDGTVFSCGRGPLGLGATVYEASIATPIDTTNLAGKKITQIAVGWYHNLLLADDGSVYAFGSNQLGQAGLGWDGGSGRGGPIPVAGASVATPVDTTYIADRAIVQVATNGNHSLLLADDGTVFSCGPNLYGRTGQGLYGGYTYVPTPIDMTNLADKTIVQVAAGLIHSLLLADDGTVFSFGANVDTGTGVDDGYTLAATPIDTTNLAGRRIVDIAAGSTASLLLADDGTVFSFGRTLEIGLGIDDNSVTTVATPIDTTNLAGMRVVGITSGHHHSLLLAVPVPEPGTAVLVMIAGVWLLRWRKR